MSENPKYFNNSIKNILNYDILRPTILTKIKVIETIIWKFKLPFKKKYSIKPKITIPIEHQISLIHLTTNLTNKI